MRLPTRTPRAERPRFQRLPLPVWVRALVLTVGWICIILGVAGIFLPILQGGLLLAIGLALLSIGSQTVHLWARRVFGRWPGLWKRIERLRRKIHSKLTRASAPTQESPPASPPPDES